MKLKGNSNSTAFCFYLKTIPLLLFFLLFSSPLFSQTYPVQLSIQLVPPYSGYLPDYADPGSEKLKIILQFNDFSKPQYDLKLKLEIKGNGFSLVTKQLFIPPPITLQPGVPLLLSGADLAPYLNSNNLDFIGINQSTYEQRMALPEGYYSICVTAYDYYNSGNIQVSNNVCANAWFTLSDPPYLNLPLCGSALTPLTPQNIVFQWMPVNIGSPNSANNTDYTFELWEVRPDSSVNPNTIVLSTAPIFSTTTNLTLLNYGITEPPLNLYMKYVWRVRAKDLSGRDWIKNNGYSQICTFVYGNLANVLGNSLSLTLNAQGITHRLGQCTWNTQSIFTNYLLQVRKVGTTNWFDFTTSAGTEKVNNLEPNTDYEARVRGEGSSMTGAWSNLATFRTLNEPVYGCGDLTQLVDPLPAQALPVSKAVPGLIIQTGQFEVATTEIFPNGLQGWYRGKGYARVFGLPVAVEFKNIYIDDNNRHQQGTIQALTKGITTWMQQWDVTQAEENASYVNGTMDSVYVNGNQVCVSFQGNLPDSCFEYPPNQNVIVVRDENGNQYNVQLIPPPPKITGPFNYLKPSEDVLEASDSTLVVFEANANQQYGFDKKQYVAWTMNYELIKLKNNKNYFVPYKSVGENQSDKVNAVVNIIGFDASKLSFKTSGGQSCAHTSAGTNTYEITVPADAGAVYAWYNGKKIGKINVVSLKALSKKLVLVPVNNAAINNQTLNNQTLNNIFRQANINWTVQTKPSFSFSLNPAGLEKADATLMSKYSNEMRALRDAYRKYDSLYDKEAYYVFVVNNFSDPNLKGYMVRGRALGFISGAATAKDLAHELAHGAFGLEHTFPAIPQSASNNLMDYKQGVELSRLQWEEMHTRPPSFIWLGDDEVDASMSDERNKLLTLLSSIKLAYKENGQISLDPLWNELYINKTYLNGIDYDYIKITKATNKPLIKPSNGIVNMNTSPMLATANNTPLSVKHIFIDSCLQISVPENRILNMIAYLKSSVPTKNLILFVNGYRPIVNFDGSSTVSLTEYANTDNQVTTTDLKNYWKGIDADFINRIGTRNTVYADGHFGVYTANHLNINQFALSLTTSLRAQYSIADAFYKILINGSLFYTYPSRNCFHVDSCVHLNTTKNTTGFSIRKSNGISAGYNLVTLINNGTVSFNKATDTLDIVAHSMGYAYAVGMIQALKASNIRFGRCYIIAPENANADGADWSQFQEVWQYGSNLDQPNRDPLWEQDGVAPQAPVKGIELLPNTKGGRVFIPQGVKKDFIESHSVSNYKWIFNKTINDPGYVKKRN